jgi:hypothetical protein
MPAAVSGATPTSELGDITSQKNQLPPAIVGGKVGKAATQQLERHAGRQRCYFLLVFDFH